jgi:biotin carboxylase
MKLLAIEPQQYMHYYQGRYQRVETYGHVVYVLNGIGTTDFWPAERYRLAGSKHIDDIVAEARRWHAEEHFDGVITFAEFAVTAVAAVAEALGLPGIDVRAAVQSRNKYLMRQAYQRGGAPIPSYRYVAELPDALAAAEEFGYPVILKPTLGAGSYYVFKVHNPQEMQERFGQAQEGIAHLGELLADADGMDLGPNGLLVESFLEGKEYLIEGVVWDDEVYLGSVVDRITAEGDNFDDDVHHAPTTLGAQDLVEVHRAVAVAAHAQGLRRSVMHAEVRFSGGKPHLLEIAARVGGGGLETIAQLTADHDPIKATVEISLGRKPAVRHFRPTGTHITAMCLISAPGIVEEVVVPEEVSSSDKVFLLKITAEPGDRIKRPPDGNTILGFLGTKGSSFEEAFDTMNDFASKIQVTFATPATLPSELLEHA